MARRRAAGCRRGGVRLARRFTLWGYTASAASRARPAALSAFVTRDEAEQHVRTLQAGTGYEYRVDVVPMDL